MAVIKETKGDKILNIFIITVLTMIMIIVLYPLIYMLSCSVSDPTLVSTGKVWLLPKGINIEAYKMVFQDKEILTGYRNTIIYTLGGTFINLLFTLPAAYALSKKHFIGRNAIMFFMAFTMYFSGGLIPGYIIVQKLGLLNTWAILMICGAVQTYNLIIARTFFETGIPRELEEAAMIDGCSTTRMFLSIILPLSKALIAVLALYYGVGHWNSFFTALIYVTDRDKIPLQLVLRELLIQNTQNATMMQTANEEAAAYYAQLANLLKYAVIVVSSLPILIVYPFLQKYFNQGVMIGSIKG